MKLKTGWDKKSAARVGEGQTLLHRTAKRKYFYHNETGEEQKFFTEVIKSYFLNS